MFEVALLKKSTDTLWRIVKFRVKSTLARIVPMHSMVVVAMFCWLCDNGRIPWSHEHGCVRNCGFLILVASFYALNSQVNGRRNLEASPFTVYFKFDRHWLDPANSPISPATTAKNPPAWPEKILPSESACSLFALSSRYKAAFHFGPVNTLPGVWKTATTFSPTKEVFSYWPLLLLCCMWSDTHLSAFFIECTNIIRAVAGPPLRFAIVAHAKSVISKRAGERSWASRQLLGIRLWNIAGKIIL